MGRKKTLLWIIYRTQDKFSLIPAQNTKFHLCGVKQESPATVEYNRKVLLRPPATHLAGED
jgi:hypothetical protein